MHLECKDHEKIHIGGSVGGIQLYACIVCGRVYTNPEDVKKLKR